MWSFRTRFVWHLLAVSFFGAILSLTLIVLPSGAFAASSTVEATVSGVRFGDHSKTLTRVVIDLSAKVDFSIFTLSSPYRVVVDLPEVAWDIPKISNVAGVVKKFRYGLFKARNSRLVLDVESPVAVKKAFILESDGTSGPRLVIDLEKVSQAAFVKARGKQPQSPPVSSAKTNDVSPPSSPYVLPPNPEDLLPKTVNPSSKPRKRTIVLDPGHGGVDPGATGKSGRSEKNITLAMAKELKKKFEATGRYRVVLTRNKDIFIRLRDRLTKARHARGDLFISLHADSIKNRRIKGLSIYTLSENASDKEAAALAKSENKSDLIAGIDLAHETPEVIDILIDLARRETMNLSTHFANFLIMSFRRQVKLLHKTHRFAGFAVLKAPDIPSVLVELGYLSNIEEERLLRDIKYRDKLGAAIVVGVDKFFAWKDNLRQS